MTRVIANVPASAKRGEVIEIRTLAGHDMETGFRRTQTGELVPRDIITKFTCTYNGEEIFRADLHPAIAANPLIALLAGSGIALRGWNRFREVFVTNINPVPVPSYLHMR